MSRSYVLNVFNIHTFLNVFTERVFTKNVQKGLKTDFVHLCFKIMIFLCDLHNGDFCSWLWNWL